MKTNNNETEKPDSDLLERLRWNEPIDIPLEHRKPLIKQILNGKIHQLDFPTIFPPRPQLIVKWPDD